MKILYKIEGYFLIVLIVFIHLFLFISHICIFFKKKRINSKRLAKTGIKENPNRGKVWIKKYYFLRCIFLAVKP